MRSVVLMILIVGVSWVAASLDDYLSVNHVRAVGAHAPARHLRKDRVGRPRGGRVRDEPHGLLRGRLRGGIRNYQF